MKSSLRHERVMIVDDYQTRLDALCDLLWSEGFSVWGVGCGLDALTLLKNQNIDIILCNCSLVDMDGIDLCNLLKNQYPCAEFYLMADFGELENPGLAYSSGVTGIFRKPFSLENMLYMINRSRKLYK